MAFKGGFRGKKKGNDNGVRLTGLFKTKRPGCYVGKMRAEEIKPLRMLLKKAVDTEKDIAVFLYKNDNPGDGPLFSLKAALNEEMQKSGKYSKKPARRKPVEEEEEEGEEEADEATDESDAEEDTEEEEVDV